MLPEDNPMHEKSIFREGLARAVIKILIVMIKLIDAASRELSNGGHVVLDVSCGNLAPEPDLGSGSALPITF